MSTYESLHKFFLKVNEIFTQDIQDFQKRHRLLIILYSQIFEVFLVIFQYFFDNSFTLEISIIITCFIAGKLILMKLRYEGILKIMLLFDFIIIPHSLIQEKIPIKSFASYLIIPYLVYLHDLPSKYCVLICIANVYSAIEKKSKLMWHLNFMNKIEKDMISGSYNTLLVVLILMWVIGFIYFKIVQNFYRDFTFALSELQTSNAKLSLDIKQLEIENNGLKKSKDDFEEALRSKDRLLASVSHELRNPLNGILANIELVMSEIKNEIHQEGLKIAMNSGQILLNLINNLIDASNISSGQIELLPKRINAYQMIEKIWSMHNMQIINKSLEGYLLVFKDFPRYIRIDEQRVIQIVSNILGNSIKFTEKGFIKLIVSWHIDSTIDKLKNFDSNYTNLIGSHKILFHKSIANDKNDKSIEFEEHSSDAPCVIYGILQKRRPPKSMKDVCDTHYHTFNKNVTNIFHILNKNVRKAVSSANLAHISGILKFEIIDTGCGVNEETQSKLFSPFIQEDNSITRKYGGPGLGLFIANSLINKMSGIILCKSKKNVATDFIALIPCQEIFKSPSMFESENHIKDPLIPLHYGKKAMVVDDLNYNQKVIKSLLQKLGFEITLCSDGQEAYQTYIRNPPGYFSFITLDIQMPKIDGISCAKMIRKYENSLIITNKKCGIPIPIIFVSGNCEEKERLICLDPHGSIKAAFYYKKPLTFTDCQYFVQEVMPKNSSVQSIGEENPTPLNIRNFFDLDETFKSANNEG